MYSFGIRMAEAKTKPNLGLLQQMAESHSIDNLLNYCDYIKLFPNFLKYPNREHLFRTKLHSAAWKRPNLLWQDTFCRGSTGWPASMDHDGKQSTMEAVWDVLHEQLLTCFSLSRVKPFKQK